MKSHDEFRRSVTSDKLKSVFDTWDTLRAGRLGPKREDVVPSRLRSMLPSSFIIDVVDGGKDFRFGFAGDRIIQFMGRRFAGSLLSTLTGTPFFDAMRAMYAGCVAKKAPLTSGIRPATYPGREFLEIEVIVMPLSEDDATVTALFGAFDSWQIGTHATKP